MIYNYTCVNCPNRPCFFKSKEFGKPFNCSIGRTPNWILESYNSDLIGEIAQMEYIDFCPDCFSKGRFIKVLTGADKNKPYCSCGWKRYAEDVDFSI